MKDHTMLFELEGKQRLLFSIEEMKTKESVHIIPATNSKLLMFMTTYI